MLNRIAGSSALTDQLQKPHCTDTVSQLIEPTDCSNEICLFGPERYEPRYDYPLVVWLHSCFSCERELEFVMPELSLQNYVACAPRGTVPSAAGTKFRWGTMEAASAHAEEVIFEAIDSASSQFSIDSRKIFLAGFGSGATMAWRVALRYPQRFSGVVAICGDFPHKSRPLTNFSEARSLPCMWLYGNESKTCGVQQICDSLPLLHSASLSVDIRQYPCGNELLSNMLLDANVWLMEQVTHQPANMCTIQEESFSRN